MVTGGSEAAITHMGLGGFASMRALSTRNDDPSRASRPFDRDRDGFVLAEGAGILILEAEEIARTPRGADLRRALGLRHVGRRLAHHRPRRGRPRRRSRHEALPRRRAARPRRRRLHQRPRHQHAAGRPGRDPRHEGSLRPPRPPAADLQHQEPARPPAGRFRRRRAGHRRPWPFTPACSPPPSTSTIPAKAATSTTSPTSPARHASIPSCPTASASAAITPAC